MRFSDRADAGRQLARALADFAEGDGIVYALPRGGVTLGAEIARALGLRLDVIIPRKLGHPWNPEYAIGAVTEAGAPILNEAEAARIDRGWLDAAIERERSEARRRRERYLAGREPCDPRGRTAILVDDGLATGMTMKAAVRAMREREPARVVVAVPVAPADTVEDLRNEADEVIALHAPRHFLGGIGAYYDDFHQVADETVVAILNEVAAGADANNE